MSTKNIHKQSGLLSKPVVKLPDGKNHFSWSDLFNGNIILGSAGSGKTSGPGAWILGDILQDSTKPGGLLLCVKKDERLRLEDAIKKAGRADDMVIISAENPFKVNALAYELFRKGGDKIEYNEALNILMEIFLLGENYEAGGSASGKQERFWEKSLKRCLIRLMMILVLAKEPVSIQNMRRVLIDIFDEGDIERYSNLWMRIEQDQDQQQEEAMIEYEEWCRSNFFLSCFEKANTREDLSPIELETMQLVGDYFLKTFCKISDRTKAIIVESAMGLFEPFNSGILKSHFSTEMSEDVKPEKCIEEGKLIIVDIPIKEFGISAVYAAGMTKKIFQQCMERRVVALEVNPRPCFLWIDEYHFFISPVSDQKFQSSCRSTMTAAIYLTQTINNIKAAMGEDSSIAKSRSLLSNLSTSIFCGNICRDTNLYAANMIGKEFIKTNSSSIDTNSRASQTTNEQLHYIIPPEHFAALDSGGNQNNFKVETIIVCRGKLASFIWRLYSISKVVKSHYLII